MHRLFVGISSGSSLGGVDAALIRVSGTGTSMTLQVEHTLHAPFGAELRELLVRTLNSAAPEVKHVAMLHRVLGETYALTVRQLLDQSRQLAQHIWAIGCPGLTLWHDAEGRYPSTLNLGMAGIVAERTGLTTLSDFATRDLALGGQGTSLNAIVDAYLFHHPREHRVHMRLGSIASLTSIPMQLGQNHRQVLGFEAAPATLLLDGLMRLMTKGREPFDNGGKHAVQGRCLEPLVERWLQNHFFHEPPPKSVSRREFGLDFLNRAIEQAHAIEGNLHDVLCSMTHFIARSIVHAIQMYLPAGPTRILMSGRGLRNGFLWHLLEQKLSPIPLERIDDHAVPSDAYQAVASAMLTALTLDGVPCNLPGVTGASGQRLLGQFTPGTTPNWSRCLTWMARQTAPAHVAA